MFVTALIFAALAALLHVYIFVLESLLWLTPRARATFGTTLEQANANREMAFNQGFYNLFLAVLVFVGIASFAWGHATVGATLVFAGLGCMTAAALVLLLSSPRLRAAALKQGTVPALGLATLALSLAL